MKLALIGLTVKVAVQAPALANLSPLRAEIREQFAEVRAELRDHDRRLLALERHP